MFFFHFLPWSHLRAFVVGVFASATAGQTLAAFHFLHTFTLALIRIRSFR